MTPSAARVRGIREDDVEVVVELLHELAAYVRDAESCVLDAAQLRSALFDPPVALFGSVADDDGEVVGFVVGSLGYSTDAGSRIIRVEDLYVRQSYRGHKLGSRLMSRLAAMAIERGYPQMEWGSRDWNTRTNDLYRTIGARPVQDYHIWRLKGSALAELSELSTDPASPSRTSGT